jgi:hypothetical protein
MMRGEDAAVRCRRYCCPAPGTGAGAGGLGLILWRRVFLARALAAG